MKEEISVQDFCRKQCLVPTVSDGSRAEITVAQTFDAGGLSAETCSAIAESCERIAGSVTAEVRMKALRVLLSAYTNCTEQARRSR